MPATLHMLALVIALFVGWIVSGISQTIDFVSARLTCTLVEMEDSLAGDLLDKISCAESSSY